jgi:hypothetical protein
MREQRLFTLEEALALLPALRDLVEQIQARKRDLDSLSAELDHLVETTESNGHEGGSRFVVLRDRTATAASDLQLLIGRLQDLGCELKGIEQGLVDFPSMRDGRVVYLCWQAGEDTIAFWHELDTGFAGRKPL